MPTKRKEQTTTLHEVCVSLVNLKKRIICHIDADERDRLLSVLENERGKSLAFYGFNLDEGLECYLNVAHISKINVLDYLAGVPFEKPLEKTEEEWSKKIEDREESDSPVYLRVWAATDQSPEVYSDVNYHEWAMIRLALEGGDQSFIGFNDEDGERVILSTSHIAAIEVFDTHYLTDEELNRALKDNDKPIN